jgi:hypothetical protein
VKRQAGAQAAQKSAAAALGEEDRRRPDSDWSGDSFVQQSNSLARG